MTERRYPRIRVSGAAYERGEQYGRAARDRVLRSKQGYERAFAHAAGWSWDHAVEAAGAMVSAVRSAFPTYVEEMQGIADGAGLSFEDVFAMNARTEVMWAATVRQSDQLRGALARECSSFALTPERTASGHTYVGQTWDWLVQGFETVVVLEVEQDEGPNFVTVVEAGLLAKSSLNSSGLGVCVNTLVTSEDRGETGVPFHVLIRALADCHSVTDAVYVLSKNRRASSGNFMIGHVDGTVLNLETSPGDARGVTPQLPDRGALVHTNHFVDPPGYGTELASYAMADSYVRLQRVRTSIMEDPSPATVSSLHEAMCDHADYPASVCCHPDAREDDAEQWATVMAVVMDLDERTLHLSEGNPCEAPPAPMTFGDLLHKESPLVALQRQRGEEAKR
ncbi:C45 family autoproteolytic acyltransferase/hydolase [Nocardioides caldifontis]|uniref:C45 family autoproteolytic acyltransferase/hydolase n=1 Tax=Nocardioides caldifontis TaxID=2588938 RepID=UPI0011E01C18|nr:C45 family peptidase [Nocardioides caldifontis]